MGFFLGGGGLSLTSARTVGVLLPTREGPDELDYGLHAAKQSHKENQTGYYHNIVDSSFIMTFKI